MKLGVLQAVVKTLFGLLLHHVVPRSLLLKVENWFPVNNKQEFGMK
jgi:hypothetical protein